jgi:predicted amidohydrolase
MASFSGERGSSRCTISAAITCVEELFRAGSSGASAFHDFARRVIFQDEDKGTQLNLREMQSNP